MFNSQKKAPPCINLWETTAGKSLFSWLILELAAGAELVKERRQKEEEKDKSFSFYFQFSVL